MNLKNLSNKSSSVFKKQACLSLVAAVFSGLFLLIPADSFCFKGVSSKTVFDNGLTVIISEMPSSPMVSVYALVKAGSATEGQFMGSGVSHFLEHLLFKGTQKRKVGEIASQIQAVGGNINASTSFDYTIYTITVPHEAFDIALDILADMVMNSVIDAQEIERERTVVHGEMRLNNDNPDRKLSQLVFDHVYIVHPYKYPIIGFETLFDKLTRENIVDYYHQMYAPNNMVVSVAGQLKTEEVLPKIKKAFESYESKNYLVRNLPLEPPQITPRLHEEAYPTNLTRLNLSFSGVKLLDPDLYALDVLAKILGDGESSRLYLDVYKQRGLVYQIAASNYTPVDRGFFEVDSVLEKKNVETTIKAILENIESIKKTGVTKEEIDKAKRQVLSENILSQQRSSHLAHHQAIDEAYTGDYQFSDKYVEAIRLVTADDVKYVANQYLNINAMTTVILKPQDPNARESLQKARNLTSDISKVTFDNGLTVLLKEDHTFPVVATRLVLNAGTRQENAQINGLSALTAKTWLKGTKTKSANQIAKESESLGISLDSHSGKNSIGISMEFLSENQAAALGLLEDIVKNPVFPEDEIFKTKDILKASIMKRDDNINQYTARALKQILFLTHPFRLDEEGTNDSVNRLTRQHALEFYDRFAAPNNMVLAVYGDINIQRTLEDLKKRFGSLAKKGVKILTHSENPPAQIRQVDLTMDKEQAMIMLGFQGVKISDPDYYGMEVLANILGSSFSGRLFTNIREQLGQAYTLGGDFVAGIDTGMIYFYVLTTNENVDRVKELVIKEIEKLQKEYIDGQELEDVKTYLKGSFKANQETSASLSFMTSLDELYGLGYNNYKQFDEQIDKVTKLDIRRLAIEYLDPNKMAVVVTRPKNSSFISQ